MVSDWKSRIADITDAAYCSQVLAAHVGIISGKHLGALCVERYGNGMVKYTIWLFIQVGVFGDDIQACVGATTALQIMTKLPWWACCLLTIVVSVLLTLAYYWSATKLEVCVGLLLLGMLVLVCVNASYGHVNVPDILKGWVVPLVPAGQVLFSHTKPCLGLNGSFGLPSHDFIK